MGTGSVPLSRRLPWMKPFAMRVHQTKRWIRWQRDVVSKRVTWAATIAPPLPHQALEHASVLLRELGETEMWMQHNEVTNLRLATAHTNGLVIRPGETFSFNQVVGNCTRRKGYVDGMRLSQGETQPGVGGGICQLANLIHWMVLHSPLTVVERSEHSFDPFPDNGRVLPWGVGCSIVWNYVDLVIYNDTDITFQLITTVGDEHLHGELRCSEPLPVTYTVTSRDDRFTRVGEQVWRSNAIWRTEHDRDTGAVVWSELIKTNRARVKYDVDEALISAS